MDIKGRILQSLRPRRDGVLLRSDVSSFGSPSQVSTALKALCAEGLMVRVDQGIYAKPQKLRQMGQSGVLQLAKTRLRQSKVRPIMGQGRLTTTARQVQNLARRAGVEFVPTYADRWAYAVTKLAGDDVKSDPTDDLLVALTREGKLKPDEMVKMVIAHHRALKHV